MILGKQSDQACNYNTKTFTGLKLSLMEKASSLRLGQYPRAFDVKSKD